VSVALKAEIVGISDCVQEIPLGSSEAQGLSLRTEETQSVHQPWSHVP